MTITTTTSSIAYEGNGVSTTFSYGFLIPSQDDLVVTITDSTGAETVLLTSEYTVTGIDDPDGGIVTYPVSGSALALLSFITIARDLPLEQNTDLVNQSGYYPQVVEDALDYGIMVSQQINGEFSRALVAPLSDPAANLTIPNATSRAGFYLAFDSSGNPIAGTPVAGATVSSVMKPVVEAATLAASRTAYGLGTLATLGLGTGFRNDGAGNAQVNNTTVADTISQAVVAAFNQTQRIATGPITYTLARANTLWNGFSFYIFANTGAITITPNAADAIGNLSVGTSFIIQPGTFARITTDGAASGVWSIDSHLLSMAVSAGAVMLNGCITEGHSGSAATFSIKTLAGNDPSTADPVYFIFRSVTAGSGLFLLRTVTAALSVTVVSGATMGFVNATSARIWLMAIDNAGTVELAVINARNGINIYPLQGWGIVSTTVMNTSSDNAAVPYSTSARSNVAYVTLGYLTWETGLTTAGTWDASPTRIQLAGYGVPLPGMTVQIQLNITGAVATGATVVPSDDTVPQITEGDQYMTQAITPTSAANLLEVRAEGQFNQATASNNNIMALFQDATAGALAVSWSFIANGNANRLAILYVALSALSVSTTFRIREGSGGAGTTTFNGVAAGRLFGGVANSYLRVTEIMA